ncbi:MAG: hypothetical protein ACXWWK_04005 [Gemmatimonadales bacterium]
MSRWYLVLIGMLFAPNLSAQGTVVLPEPKLDAGRAALRDALLHFRDTLNTIDAAASRLQRDYRQASSASLLSRARVMRQACGGSVSSEPAARKAVLGAEASSDLRLRRQTEMVAALDQLKKALVRCESEFAAMSKAGQGETVRGYGNERAGRVQAALRQYERALGSFFSAMGIKVTPLGAESRQLAG